MKISMRGGAVTRTTEAQAAMSPSCWHELEKEKVDGVVIDLRNNGGGSLPQAIELTGLFVGKGPVLQQRNGDGEIKVNGNKRATARWTGPLAVLINRGSASASEIFAAAIQDYGRGVIIGEPSFGKGTVQTVVDLDEEARNPKPEFGELKMTVAQFFRINGGTTQLRGVTPDIACRDSRTKKNWESRAMTMRCHGCRSSLRIISLLVISKRFCRSFRVATTPAPKMTRILGSG